MEKLTVTKSNELIENFIFNATEMELQILNYAVSKLNPRWDNNGIVIRLNIPELVKTFKTNSKRAYEHYRNALKRLMRREYSYFDDNNKRHDENLVIRTTRHVIDKSWLEFKFNEYISKRLSELTTFFTSYNIRQIAMFKSRYAFILYDFFIMKLNHSVENCYAQKISVGLFKKNLDISKKYARFNQLREYVLEVARTNINKHSDINLDYQVIKTGRTPTHIKFTAKYKKKAQPKELETKTSKPVEHQTKLALDSESTTANVGFTEKHKATSKPHLDNLKQKWT